MNVKTRDRVVQNIRLLVSRFASELPSENATDALELLDHAEWGVAFDLICTQLYEYEIPVSKEQFALIEQTARMMDMDSTNWDYLKELVH